MWILCRMNYLFFRLWRRSQALLVIAHNTGLLKHCCGHCCQKFDNAMMMICGDFYKLLSARTGGGGLRPDLQSSELEADSKVYNHG